MKSFKMYASECSWEADSRNVKWSDEKEYGRFRRILRKDSHGLTVITFFTAPPGKAWKIVGRAPDLGEEVYIVDGAYYDTNGRIVAGPGTFMFNAPGAVHGGISPGLVLYSHWCGGKPDDPISQALIDFEPKEMPAKLTIDSLLGTRPLTGGALKQI